MQHTLYQQLIEKLESSQELVEKTAFATLNQHDTVTTMVNQLTMELDSMMTKLEAMNYTLEDSMEAIRQTIGEDEMKGIREFSNQLEQQGMELIDLSQLIQSIMEEQTKESELIHELESLTEQHRESITKIKEAAISGSDK